MFSIHRQKRKFIVSEVNQIHNTVVVEDLHSGLRIAVPYGHKGLERAEFIADYELHLIYQDSNEKSVNLLMQEY